MIQSLTFNSFFFFNDTATTEIYTLSLHDALPISLVRLLVGVDRFSHAHIAAGAVLAGEAIEQAGVALAAVTMAIAGLLVKDSLHARCEGVRVLYDDVGEQRGTERLRKLSLRCFAVKRRHWLFRALRLARRRPRRGKHHAQCHGAQNRATNDSAFRSHNYTPQSRKVARLPCTPTCPLYLREREISSKRFSSGRDPGQQTAALSWRWRRARPDASHADCAWHAVPRRAQMRNSGIRRSPNWPPESSSQPTSRLSPRRALPRVAPRCAGPMSQTFASQRALSRNPRRWRSRQPATIPRARRGRGFQIRTAGKGAESAAAESPQARLPPAA